MSRRNPRWSGGISEDTSRWCLDTALKGISEKTSEFSEKKEGTFKNNLEGTPGEILDEISE